MPSAPRSRDACGRYEATSKQAELWGLRVVQAGRLEGERPLVRLMEQQQDPQRLHSRPCLTPKAIHSVRHRTIRMDLGLLLNPRWLRTRWDGRGKTPPGGNFAAQRWGVPIQQKDPKAASAFAPLQQVEGER